MKEKSTIMLARCSRFVATVVFAVSLGSVASIAEPLSAEAAAELFLKATAKERSSPALSYETRKETGEKTITEKHYSFRRQDGKILTRSESITVTRLTTYHAMFISNDSGQWTVKGDYAIRMPKQDDKAVAAVAAYREELRNRQEDSAPPDKFSGETVVRSERAFAIITRELSTERQMHQAELTRRVAGEKTEVTGLGLSDAQANYRHKKELDAIRLKIPVRFEYVIDLETGLIVETRTYNAAGGLLRQIVRQNLRIEADLPGDFFEIPAHCKRYYPASYSAYSSLVKDATLAQGADWRSKNKPEKDQMKQ